MKIRIANLISTWFGCGYVPVAPGTAGSVAAIVIAWVLVSYLHWGAMHFAVLCAFALIPAVWAAGATARQMANKDPPRIVVDEVLGQWFALTGATAFNWKSWLGAFCLFRLFDIWKPSPVRQLEALPDGRGIVADDVMAGGYAALVLFLAGCFNLY